MLYTVHVDENKQQMSKCLVMFIGLHPYSPQQPHSRPFPIHLTPDKHNRRLD